ncbi:MAG: hypothetical protein L3J95_04380 [Thermoplasmata archaeon]|nr:hypothetical protein [Thermoplasmata archaeon]MCI4359642.1 hypothetical protein [Thermoplasmata archaeon]
MRWPPRFESFAIDPVATAGTLSALAGIASVGWPFFDGMAAALAALALVGWLIGPNPPGEVGRRPLLLLGLVASIAGWAFFVSAIGPAAIARGVVLGGTAGFVGWVGRRVPAFGEGS